ncbi:MAG: GNAT family N-acetyltransferase [Oscillospiraceae bacterium]|jgi:GNAT superfamily N-acetyltransferase|nr:GNAT family N-acetyltransferase [Oscillospiraceae bacterium]
MKLEQYQSPAAFRAAALETLLRNEAQNGLMISFAQQEAGPDKADWFLAAVRGGDGEVKLVAAMTPPYPLTMYEPGNQSADAALGCLVRSLKDLGLRPPGVLAEAGLARRFASLFAGEGCYTVHMTETILRIETIQHHGAAPGIMRPMRESDLYFAPFWAAAFARDCRLSARECEIAYQAERLRRFLERDELFFWESGGAPVSMAASHRKTIRGAGIGFVYTPPHFRGKGYATSLVAALTQKQLDVGYRFCFLFADAANPISNGVYRKIGYVPVCTFDEISFAEHAGS